MLLFMERKGAPKGEPGGPAEMKKFAGELASQGKLRRGAPLVAESAGARVRVRDGKAFVSDGPFAESKEIVGGFWIIEAASREEAIEIARRCPHARHGVVEVHLVRWRDTAADPEKGIPFLFAFHTEPGLTDPDGSKMREMIGFGEALKRDGKFLETMTSVLRILRHTDVLEEEPALVAYKQRCEARPAFTQALAGQMAAFGA